jgi:probable F420-dependent oxidoreductase
MRLEDIVRIGLAVSQYGAFAHREAVIEVARAAEEIGFDSLWAGDRLLEPIHPGNRYPGSRSGRLPEQMRTFLDPLAVLTTAASVTERIRLGTSTLNAPWYPPVLLARALTSLDVLSDGRLDVGFGLGWSIDEYEAVGVPFTGRGARLDRTMDALERIWADDPVALHDSYLSVPACHIEPKPVQRPRPPIYLGGYSPHALDRVGRRADGWLPACVPLPLLPGLWRTVTRAAERAGRDPGSLRMILRINVILTRTPVGADRVPFEGTIEQYAEYARAAAGHGVDEVFIDLQQAAPDVPEMLATAERFAALVRPDAVPSMGARSGRFSPPRV